MAEIKIDVLSGASEALREILKSFETIAKSIKAAIESGHETKSYLRARKTYNNLFYIVDSLKYLSNCQALRIPGARSRFERFDSGFLPAIDAFVKSNGKDKEEWKKAKRYSRIITDVLQDIIIDIEGEEGEFVLEEEYTKLLVAIKSRIRALEKFDKLKYKNIDMDKLKEFYYYYDELYNCLADLTDSISEYAKKFNNEII